MIFNSSLTHHVFTVLLFMMMTLFCIFSGTFTGGMGQKYTQHVRNNAGHYALYTPTLSPKLSSIIEPTVFTITDM